MNLLVLAIDGFQAALPGYAGCGWTQTPELDTLAGEGLILDRIFSDRLNLSAIYDILWSGDTTLSQFASQRGYKTALLADDTEILSHCKSNGFQIIESVLPLGSDLPASELDQTHLFNVFASLTDLVESISAEPFFCWTHIGSLGKIWDAPQEYRGMYCQEGDLEPWPSTKAPNRILRPDENGVYDSDEKLQLAQTYAGQMSVLDDCLSALIDQMTESGLWNNTAVVLMSTRGIGLGEHGTVGMNYPNFHSEFARLTGAIRVPKPGTQLRRTQSLLSERAWNPIFKQLLENDRSDIFPLVESLGQSRLLGQEENNRVVQTDAWRYLFQNDSSQTGRLYALPDDRWEVNDVASICPQVIEQLKAVTADSPLSELLTDVRH